MKPSGCDGYTATSGRDILEPNPCVMPVRETVTAGCIHEHVGQRDLCVMHAEDIRLGRMLCGECLEADGHKCWLTAMALVS